MQVETNRRLSEFWVNTVNKGQIDLVSGLE